MCRGTTRKAMYVYRNIEVHLCNRCCSGKAISTTYSECVSIALVIQHAKRIRRILLLSVACPAPPHFFATLSHEQHDFRGKKLLDTTCLRQATFSTHCTHLATRLSNITTATTVQTTIGSGTQSVLLTMGIKMPETC